MHGLVVLSFGHNSWMTHEPRRDGGRKAVMDVSDYDKESFFFVLLVFFCDLLEQILKILYEKF